MLQGSVIRGTTPLHSFELPYPIEIIDDIRVIYGQGKQLLFTKTKSDCVIENNEIQILLSQEETLMFTSFQNVFIEIKIKLKNGKVVRNEEPILLRVIDTIDVEVFE